MPKNQGGKNWFKSDEIFNSLYPLPVKNVAEKHWTPIAVAEKAAAFLAVSNDVKILDIGSGCGKFCLVAAHLYSKTNFYGIEQREGLVSLSEQLADQLQIKNVFFTSSNIAKVDFSDYDHFYFYNSFYENIASAQKIDDDVIYSEELYNYYNRYLYKQLDKKTVGTRLVTYHSFGKEVPRGFEIVHTDYNEYLKFWIKV